jgi:hypothetical protein
MTTIEEMDEFFNFDAAAHQLVQNGIDFSHLESGPYDIDLAFAEPENDENSFTCLQHFSEPDAQLSMGVHDASVDTTMMGPLDFTDFPRWIDGMEVPTQACANCRRMRIHCKVIKEGLRKGSCTSPNGRQSRVIIAAGKASSARSVREIHLALVSTASPLLARAVCLSI